MEVAMISNVISYFECLFTNDRVPFSVSEALQNGEGGWIQNSGREDHRAWVAALHDHDPPQPGGWESRKELSRRRRGASYLVGTPRAQLKAYECRLLEGDWQKVSGEVQLLAQDKETYVLARSRAFHAKMKRLT